MFESRTLLGVQLLLLEASGETFRGAFLCGPPSNKLKRQVHGTRVLREG